MNSSILIKRNIKKIIVNESGDFIELDLQDRNQYSSIINFVNQFVSKYKKLEQYKNWHEICNVCEFFESQIDSIFGPETVRKIFNGVHPSIDSIILFMIEFAKEFGKFRKEIEDNMSKSVDDFNKYIDEKYGDKYLDKNKLR